MKHKNFGLVLMTLSIIMIVAGCVSSFVISLESDKANTQNRMISVTEEFESFSTYITKFEEARDELYTKYLSNVYYDTLKQEDQVIKNKLTNYEGMVDQINGLTTKLDNLCEDMYYPESNVNNMCSNYKMIYEQVVNYFVKDITSYNKNIKAYNNYQVSLGSADSLKEYKTTKKYIDYDKDNNYTGKEE